MLSLLYSMSGPSCTVNNVGVGQKLIIMFIFAEWVPQTCFLKKQVRKAVITTRFLQNGYPTNLSRYLFLLFREVGMKIIVQHFFTEYLLFFKLGSIQSKYGHLLFYKQESKVGRYPYPLSREAVMLHAEHTRFSKFQMIQCLRNPKSIVVILLGGGII